jgi:hypothetical protein
MLESIRIEANGQDSNDGSSSISEPASPPWFRVATGLVSWWDVEKFAADHFCALAAEMERQAA